MDRPIDGLTDGPTKLSVQLHSMQQKLGSRCYKQFGAFYCKGNHEGKRLCNIGQGHFMSFIPNSFFMRNFN